MFAFHLIESASHKAFNREHCVFRVDHCLSFGGLPHKALAIFIKSNHRRAQARAFSGVDDLGVSTLHNGYH